MLHNNSQRRKCLKIKTFLSRRVIYYGNDKNRIDAFFAIFGLGCSIINARQRFFNERLEVAPTNLVDAALFTFTAKVVSDFCIENSEDLSLIERIGYAVGSWLCSKFLEALYKELYPRITGQSLGVALKKDTIAGFEVSYQHVVRRAITLAPLLIALYVHAQNPADHDSILVIDKRFNDIY